jgi:hypothetical protein
VLNSWGKFPASGFLRGTLTDLGAFDQCIETETNQIIGSPQYCLIDFVPILPPMPKNHNIFHELNLIDRNKNTSYNNLFRRIENNAQFLYYISWRIGICLPSFCDKSDVKKLSEECKNSFKT